ncbi:hypothetical protein DVH24_020838 [Malus domestica]|uniref:Response regulatory domain-containing protein n=1 Tax=Malus domestica TaxID=3750 RepID=A0A498JAE4_MALDO|nr:hypothetical protein DVH24_020838 [Malus domestica]
MVALKRMVQSSVSTTTIHVKVVAQSIEMAIPDQFPANLWVLVVDDDTTCLRILKLMFLWCLYQGMSLIF